MMGFNSFRSARTTLQGIELMHMIKKGQMASGYSQGLSAAEQFYSLAAEKPAKVAKPCSKEINATQPSGTIFAESVIDLLFCLESNS